MILPAPSATPPHPPSANFPWKMSPKTELQPLPIRHHLPWWKVLIFHADWSFLVGRGPHNYKFFRKKIMKHPWRLTWNIIMEVWKIIFLFKWVICRFHVNLPGWIDFSLKFTCIFFWRHDSFQASYTIRTFSVYTPQNTNMALEKNHPGKNGRPTPPILVAQFTGGYIIWIFKKRYILNIKLSTCVCR